MIPAIQPPIQQARVNVVNDVDTADIIAAVSRQVAHWSLLLSLSIERNLRVGHTVLYA